MTRIFIVTVYSSCGKPCGIYENNIKYRQLISILHINDLKNVIKRMGNRKNINVHYVNPMFTSQTCPICGHISKDNRKIQETFSCVKCKHISNADLNSSINIKNRIIPYIDKQLYKLFDLNSIEIGEIENSIRYLSNKE